MQYYNNHRGGKPTVRSEDMEYRVTKMPTFPIGSFMYAVEKKTCSNVFTWCHLKNFPTEEKALEYIKTNPTTADRD